jgi:single-strand DNA-binding protein
MADLANSCQFIGNLGADPERGYLQDGTARVRYRIAVNDRKRNANGETAESTFWVSVTALGKQAELAADRLRKGSRVLIRGKLEPREWTGNDGVNRFSLDLLQRDMEFLDTRRDGTPAEDTPVAAAAGVAEESLPF